MNPLLPPGLIFPFRNCVSQNSTIFTLLWAAWVSQSLQGRGVSWAKGEAGRVAGNLFFLSCIVIHLLTPQRNAYCPPTMCQVLGAGGTVMSEAMS